MNTGGCCTVGSTAMTGAGLAAGSGGTTSLGGSYVSIGAGSGKGLIFLDSGLGFSTGLGGSGAGSGSAAGMLTGSGSLGGKISICKIGRSSTGSDSRLGTNTTSMRCNANEMTNVQTSA